VEKVHTGEAPDFFIVIKFTKADSALIHLFFFIIASTKANNLLKLVRESVSFNASTRSSPVVV
jgi:hypothetical protein